MIETWLSGYFGSPHDLVVTIHHTSITTIRGSQGRRAVVAVNNYMDATFQIAQTSLRSVIGQVELDELLGERDRRRPRGEGGARIDDHGPLLVVDLQQLRGIAGRGSGSHPGQVRRQRQAAQHEDGRKRRQEAGSGFTLR